ncbi:GNAT family N-acetyltransferase [Vibrio maerlii]|uniref:GNAT family N-acetyltransferase n=1 Tax=Vibrio maerlii TaxID=2231648 RepID=UPI000E3E3A24|nr:GNAT family N-acetyltransferase [Vibrio maerlii]
MTIVTNRTLLVPYTEEHMGDFIRLNCCPINRAEMNGPHKPKSAMGLFENVLKVSHQTPTSAMAVLDLSTREYIGHVFISREDNDFELGFIFDKSVWGQGIATEVLSAYLPKAIYRMDLTHIIATVNTHHTPSKKLLERLGFDVTAQKEDEYGPYFYMEKQCHELEAA